MNEDLIRYRREKSKETLEDAYILFRAGRLLSALNRIYGVSPTGVGPR